jgi:hypothetical protein
MIAPNIIGVDKRAVLSETIEAEKHEKGCEYPAKVFHAQWYI